MKIFQLSNIYLGKSFKGFQFPGDKLRAAIKGSFIAFIDKAIEQKADLVVLAGDTFANVDISQNLIDMVVAEIGRLGKIPAVLMPGVADKYEKESFWARWQISPPSENLFVLNENSPVIDFPDLDVRVYGYLLSRDGVNLPKDLKNDGQFKYRVAVVYDDTETKESSPEISSYREKILGVGFDYIALGGENEYASFVELGMKAAYSGSPLTFSPELKDAGYALAVNLEPESVSVERIAVSDIAWKEIDFPMESIVNIDDLKGRALELAGPNVILNVSLTGLALLEAGLNLSNVEKELIDNFLHVRFFDKSSVLPDNVSGIKVQEKTIMGQYLKLMIEKLNNAEELEKRDLEESLKIGYALLSGQEIW